MNDFEKYYYHNGIEELGPYSLEELSKMNINIDFYFWKAGMSEWEQGSKLDAIKKLVKQKPPTFNVKPPTFLPNNSSGTKTVGNYNFSFKHLVSSINYSNVLKNSKALFCWLLILLSYISYAIHSYANQINKSDPFSFSNAFLSDRMLGYQNPASAYLYSSVVFGVFVSVTVFLCTLLIFKNKLPSYGVNIFIFLSMLILFLAIYLPTTFQNSFLWESRMIYSDICGYINIPAFICLLLITILMIFKRSK